MYMCVCVGYCKYSVVVISMLIVLVDRFDIVQCHAVLFVKQVDYGEPAGGGVK